MIQFHFHKKYLLMKEIFRLKSLKQVEARTLSHFISTTKSQRA